MKKVRNPLFIGLSTWQYLSTQMIAACLSTYFSSICLSWPANIKKKKLKKSPIKIDIDIYSSKKDFKVKSIPLTNWTFQPQQNSKQQSQIFSMIIIRKKYISLLHSYQSHQFYSIKTFSSITCNIIPTNAMLRGILRYMVEKSHHANGRG